MVDVEEITKVSDIGTPELHKQKGVELTISENKLKARVRKTSLLREYFNRGYIDYEQLLAGEELYRLYKEAILSQFPKTTAPYEIIVHTGWAEKRMTPKQSNCYERYREALRAVKDKDNARMVLVDVCVWDLSVSSMTKNTRKIAELKAGLLRSLDALARFWGIK